MSREHTLWGLTDRARFAVPVAITAAVLMVVVSIVAIAAIVSVVTFSQVMRMSEASGNVEHEPSPFASVALGTVVSIAVVGVSLRPADRRLLRRVAATQVSYGEHTQTKRALAQVAIAAGIGFPPVLYVTPERGLNAFYVGRPGTSGFAVCVTEMVLGLKPCEQRAIYANLIARALARRTRTLDRTAPVAAAGWLTIGMLEGLTGALKSVGDVDPDGTGVYYMRPMLPALTYGSMLVGLSALAALGESRESAMYGLTQVLPISLAFVVVMALLSSVMGRAQVRDAHLGDTEALLLTKEPEALIDALRWTEANWNIVPVCEPYAHLFWAWPGTPGGIGSWGARGRLERIEAVAGAAGLDSKR